MQLSDFDHVSTDGARELRNSAKRVGAKLAREKGEGAQETIAAKLLYVLYSALVESRESNGC